MIDGYDWAGGHEAMFRFGPAHGGPVVVVAMPLLEEWNRTRAFTVALLRALAERGIASVLPDLPGHGESLVEGGRLTLDQLSAAMGAVTEAIRATGRPTVGLSIRSGALVDVRSSHLGRWHLAPMTGPDLLGELHRTWLTGEGAAARDRTLPAMLAPGGATVAGTTLSAEFLRSLVEAKADTPARVVRLTSDPRAADRHVDGIPLWRRSEPGTDPAMVALLADDIAA